MTVYVLQFSAPLGSAKHRASTYIGYADPGRLQERLAEHRAGQGAAITRAAVDRGYSLQLVAAIDGGRDLERRLKNFKNARKAIRWIERQPVRLCPGCCHDLLRPSESLCWLCEASGQAVCQ